MSEKVETGEAAESVPLADVVKAKETKPETRHHDPELEEDDGDKNVFVAARGRIQRYVDVALLMSNMSQLATVIKRASMFSAGQYVALVTTLTLAMAAEVTAAILFFITHEKEVSLTSRQKAETADEKRTRARLDVAAYACVGAVMLLNLFASTFIASWTESVPEVPVVGSSVSQMLGQVQFNATGNL